MQFKHLRTAQFALWAMLGVLCALPAGAATKIYRTVDEHGNVVFTDVPPRQDEPGEQVVLSDPNSFAVEEALGPREEWIVAPEEGGGDTDGQTIGYRSLLITTPTNDESIRENTGNVTVVTTTVPELQVGHRMRLLLDGQTVSEGSETTFLLQNVDRGTHSLTAEIVDPDGRVVIASGDTTFHLLRYAQPPPRPTPN